MCTASALRRRRYGRCPAALRAGWRLRAVPRCGCAPGAGGLYAAVGCQQQALVARGSHDQRTQDQPNQQQQLTTSPPTRSSPVSSAGSAAAKPAHSTTSPTPTGSATRHGTRPARPAAGGAGAGRPTAATAPPAPWPAGKAAAASASARRPAGHAASSTPHWPPGRQQEHRGPALGHGAPRPCGQRGAALFRVSAWQRPLFCTQYSTPRKTNQPPPWEQGGGRSLTGSCARGAQPVYSCGPAETRALPASLLSYLTKFFWKREARSFALVSHSAASA